MESGLEGRNNAVPCRCGPRGGCGVSMESGLEGRNNRTRAQSHGAGPRVSMESGLEGRNNRARPRRRRHGPSRLNGVRPRRPEQYGWRWSLMPGIELCLNGVRPRRPEQWSAIASVMGLVSIGLNGVRPRRPEQLWHPHSWAGGGLVVSMESGLEGRNNTASPSTTFPTRMLSQWSPA